MSRIGTAVVVLALAASRAAALNIATGGVGTSGADFLTVGVGARALAMGGAFTAVDAGVDANAVNWNPAALSFIEKPNVTASYNALFVDQSQGYFGYAAPIGKSGGVWSAGINYLMLSNIEKRAGDTENQDSTFNNQNYAASLSYSKRIGDRLSLGGSVKYIRTSLDTLKENAVCVDVGALLRTNVENLTVGTSLRNFGTNIGPDSLPLTIKGGVAYKAFSQKLMLDSDLTWLAAERRTYWSVGGEYWISRNLAARVGYEFGHGVDQLQSSLVGVGVGLGVKVNGFSVDYAFQPYGDLGNTHHLTLGLSF